jgi:hypothetical protein
MSKYVAEQGYGGTAYPQSVIWHYKTDIDRDVLNRWFVNIFEQGVLFYTPSPDTAGGDPPTVGPTIPAGTSFLIKQKDAVSPNEKIAKVDMILDYTLPIYADGVGYALIAQWANDDDEYRGVEFYLKTPAEMALLIASGENYVQFGTVEIDSTAGGGSTPGLVSSNTTAGQTTASMYSGLNGWSGFSGEIGVSGFSGFSGFSSDSGFSGYSGVDGAAALQGDSGYSGISGYSGENPGYSGYSGISGFSGLGLSGYSGRSGYSGTSGFSGSTGSECILVTCSDESTPLTTGWKTIFRMPYGMLLTSVKASLTAVASTNTTVAIRLNADYPGSTGSNMLTTFLTIPLGTKSATVLAGGGISIPTLPNDSEILIGVNSAGTNAAGLKVYFIGNKL